MRNMRVCSPIPNESQQNGEPEVLTLSQDLNNAAAYFNVNLNQDTTELIRLDVTNTDTPCDITTLSINNQPLPLGPYQHGRGPLSLPSGSTIEALWTITCVTQDQDGQLQFNPSNISPVHDGQFANMRPGMWVVVDILEVDGEKTHAGFEANFIQGGDYVRWHFADVYEAGGAQGAEPDLVTYFGGEVDWVVPWDEESVNEASQELKWLRTGAWGDDDVEDEAAVGLGWYPSLHELQGIFTPEQTSCSFKLILTEPPSRLEALRRILHH